ncbi:hypothetical protein [Methylobacterium durans]|uniref:Uncharacterized protein n=1 Tax=Methylobacterium durans TaxID=2202825 RepID=A0A2U8W1H1_9HYPH|nr:hypothetical protein [Methylobacterium durans]AWN39934.1 hypothetical protein DK389_04485 [Methylobacterium durans]
MAREILALFDGDLEPAAADTRIHRYAELPLNHLGFTLTYRDIRKPLPDAADIRRYAGVLTWFSTTPAARDAYLAWARVAVRTARRWVILGATGASFWTDEAVAGDALLGEIGLRHRRRAIDLTLGTQLSARAPTLTAFEGPADAVLPPYEMIEAARPDLEAWLELVAPQREGGGRSVAVAVSPRGGFAASGYELVEDQGQGRARWLIDPFAFFGRALRDGPVPVPDVTTLSGRRIYFSHVESEGLNHVVLTKDREQVLVAKLFLDRIVTAFPDLPVTLALTPGDLDPAIGGNETPRDLVREIWSQPQVEPSVASYTRPYTWRFFDHYSRAREEEIVAGSRPAGRFGLRRLTDLVSTSARVDRFVAKAREYPRNYLLTPFDLGQETRVAWTAASALAPAGKAPRLYQWTGDAEPSEEAIALTRRLSLHNINGGEGRFDAAYPSVANLPPIARPVGEQRQVYAVSADDLPVRKAWRPAVSALRGLRATLANTETPRRLKGFNLHYRLATVGNADALGVIEDFLREVQGSALIPIRTVDYAALADDFPRVAIAETGPLSWEVRDRGSVQTLRFDAADAIDVDLGASQGVVGRTRHGGSLYLALDPSVEPARVVLRDGTSAPNPVGLSESRWQISGLTRSEGGWSFAASGFGPGDFRWADVPPGRYAVTAQGSDGTLWTGSAEADTLGRLGFTLPAMGVEPVRIAVGHRSDEVGGRDEHR